jgi:WXG100 family type VII secretion target
MPQAVVDPQELRRFAANLKRFNQDLEAQTGAIRGQLAGLAQTWRDREQEKFSEEFEQTVQAIARFLEISSQHIPFLLRKAERVEEYLQQR